MGQHTRDPEESVRLRSRAVALADELLRRDADNLSYRHLRIYTIVRLGEVLPAAERGRTLSLLERGLADGQALFDLAPRSPNLVVLLHQAAHRVHGHYAAAGDSERAVRVLESDLARIQKARREMPTEAQLSVSQRVTLVALASAYERAGATGKQDAIRTCRALLALLDEMDASEALHASQRADNETTRARALQTLERLGD